MMMLHKDTTIIEFGKDGLASVMLTAKFGGDVVIQPLNNPTSINSVTNPKNCREFPQIVLRFNDHRSIDAMIKILEKQKEMMTYNSYYYAC